VQGPPGQPGAAGASALALASNIGLTSGGLSDNTVEINSINSGVQLLVYGMIIWLTVITVTAVIVFAIVQRRLSRASQALDEFEAGSVSSASSVSRRSAPSGLRKRYGTVAPVHQPGRTDVRHSARLGARLGGSAVDHLGLPTSSC